MPAVGQEGMPSCFFCGRREKVQIKMKTLKKYLFPSFLLALVALFAGVNAARAGFGISPPYVKNNQIIPGSHYEQKIVLLRSSAEEDLMAEVAVNAPDIAKWITIDKGDRFLMPKDQLQVPMIVNIDPPADAEIGNYKGHINVRIAPAGENNSGNVAIALGARIDVDLTLTNVTFSDFIVRLVSIPDIERLGKPWNWKYIAPIFDRFFYKIRVAMNIQNTGNVETAPSRVHLDVYDLTENKLLESLDDKSMRKVKAFSTEQTEAAFATQLPAGQYWGKLKVYKNNEITNTYKIVFTIAEPGALGGKARDLGYGPWALLGGLILAALAVLYVLIRIRIWRYAILILAFVIAKPLSPVYRMIRNVFSAISAKFWRWVGQKAEQKTGKYGKD